MISHAERISLLEGELKQAQNDINWLRESFYKLQELTVGVPSPVAEEDARPLVPTFNQVNS